MSMTEQADPCKWGLAESAAAIASRAISAEDLATALLQRAEEQSHLNAFVSISGHVLEDARAADLELRAGHSRGPLHGVPIALKDNIDTAALPTTGGTPRLKDHRPPTDATVAGALFAAGAILFGKNTMHELAFGVTCRETPQGRVRNPHDHGAIPGGSSGGTAVAVAAGTVPAGIGTDTGGSVRIPAALCGLAGFRPTVGRWSTKGILPISHTRDTAGPIARLVRDLSFLDAIVTGEKPLSVRSDLAGIRLGLPQAYFWEGLDRETELQCRRAVETLQAAGATVVPVVIEDIGQHNADISFVIALHEPREDIGAYLTKSGSNLTFDALLQGVMAHDVYEIARSMEGGEAAARALSYRQVIETLRPRLQANYDRVFAQYRLDALVFPTTPLPARPVDERNVVFLDGEALPAFGTYIRNTDPGSNAGIPGTTLNAGYTARGLPIGLAFDGPAGSDLQLLRIAASAEMALANLARPNGRTAP